MHDGRSVLELALYLARKLSITANACKMSAEPGRKFAPYAKEACAGISSFDKIKECITVNCLRSETESHHSFNR